MADTIIAVLNQLKALFKDKNELNGFDDWDHFLGCIMTLEGVVMELQSQGKTPDEGE